jgi:hypothetical protein
MLVFPTAPFSSVYAAIGPEMKETTRPRAKWWGSLALAVAAALTATACTGGAGLDVPIGPVDHSCPVVNSCQHGR